MGLLRAAHEAQITKVGRVLALAGVLTLGRRAAHVGENVAGLLTKAATLGLFLGKRLFGVGVESGGVS